MNKETINQFTDGLIMDLNPLTTPNTVLTNCLNGTIITFNGNEHVLQNDMGNGRVETANLPEGYIPIGTCSHGGFIYIVSYNPLKGLSQIGSFPSPERNIDSTELSDRHITLSEQEFYLDDSEIEAFDINGNKIKLRALKPLIRKIFDEIELNPGDKFIIFARNLFTDNLSDWNNVLHTFNGIPRDWNIRIASIEESNKVTELENLKWYNQTSTNDINQKDYYVKITSEDLSQRGDKAIDVDNYRSIVNSAYSIFSPKKSGNLGLLISPEQVNAFTCTSTVYKQSNTYYGFFINSSWQNDGIDNQPIGILVVPEIEENKSNFAKAFKVKFIPFNNSEKFVEEQYYPLKNRVSQQNLDNVESIYRIYENAYPKLLDNIQLYYTTNDLTNLKETKIHDDIINSHFHQDVSKLYNYFSSNETKDLLTEIKKLGIVNFKIYPVMRAGYLKHLETTITYDFSMIDEKLIKLTKWKYYVESQSIFVNWSLAAYTQLGETVSKVWLEFYDNQGLCATQILDKLSSYNGEFQTKINFDVSSEYHGIYKTTEDGQLIRHKSSEIIYEQSSEIKYKLTYDEYNIITNDELKACYILNNDSYILNGAFVIDKDEQTNMYKIYVNNAGILYKNALYLVKLRYRTSKITTFGGEESEPINIDTRWLHTSTIFNSKYDSTNDFEYLNPELQLDVNVIYNGNSNYKEEKIIEKNYPIVQVSGDLPTAYDNLSATIHSIKSGGNPNIDAQIGIALENNYETFQLDASGMSDVSLLTFIGESELKTSIEQPNIIEEYSEGADRTLLTAIKENDNTLAGKRNISTLSLNNGISGNPGLSYISTVKNDVSTDIKEYNNYKFDKTGVAVVPFKYDATIYSKYYTLGKTDSNLSFNICRSPILDRQDFIKYNLMYSPFSHIGSGDDDATWDLKGICFHYGINLYTHYRKGKGNDQASISVFELSCSNDDYMLNEIQDSTSEHKGWHSWDLVNNVYGDCIDSITKINEVAKFIFPVIGVSYNNCEKSDAVVGSIYVDQKENGNGLNRIQLNNGSEGNSGWYPTNSNKWGGNKVRRIGGCLGLCLSENKIMIDFNNPINGRSNGWINGTPPSPITSSKLLIGSIFNYYAKALLGLLTQIYFKSSTTESGTVYKFDNYTYLESHDILYTSDVCYKVNYPKSDSHNQYIIIQGMNLNDYIYTVLNKAKIEINDESINKPCIQFQLLDCLKNCPIQFNFKYIQPELERVDLTDKCILKSVDSNLSGLLVTCSDNVLYVMNENNELEYLNAGTVLNSKTCDSDYNIINLSSESENYKFTIPELIPYLKIENDRLVIDKEADTAIMQHLNQVLNWRTHQNRRVTNLTGCKAIFKYLGYYEPLDTSITI